jgi:16S rRNA processing protein RimM
VEGPDHPLAEGTPVTLAGVERTVARRAGTDDRPLVRLDGLEDPRPFHDEPLLVVADLAAGEWLAADLEGCEVPGLGRVRRVIAAPSCDLLELEDGTLIPLVSDAVRRIDTDTGRIEVDREFLAR